MGVADQAIQKIKAKIDDVHAASYEGLADTGHISCGHVAPDELILLSSTSPGMVDGRSWA